MGGTNASSAVGGAGHRPGINVVELHRYRIYPAHLRIHLRVFATYEDIAAGREVTRHSSRN